MSVRTVGIGTLFLAGIAFGALSLAIARREPAFSFAGELPTRAAAELIAGWSLLAVGLVAWARRRGSGLRPAARRRLVRLVPARVEQPRHRLRARVCDRPHALRGRSTARRARRARLPRVGDSLAARAARARRRVRRGDPRARARAGARVRSCGRSRTRCPSNLLLDRGLALVSTTR